ncbi:MAG TPA: bifunctional 2-C-methyl-D-erythritol 4-phosphate cytidylyltransferase/2-C-methyl-D-erythritol 2,4-cyclodiphosphate synthase [Propylenella sp.]
MPAQPRENASLTAALVVAAGRGIRAGRNVPKQYAAVGGGTVLRRTLKALLSHPGIDILQVVIGDADAPFYAEAARGLPRLLPPVVGGATRQQSVRNGLEALAPHAPRRVLIHDAARPFVPAEVIGNVIAACDDRRGAIPVLAVNETLKRIEAGLVAATVPREALAAAQTPQGFPFAALLEAHRSAAAAGRDDLTDDAAVAALAGLEVRAVGGDRANIKLTEPADFSVAERMLEATMESRTAQGFDVHAFGPGRSVWLCGVEIPHDRALTGHSDADVGLHALTDALLGTIADGDIGEHFPPSDPKWKGASSDQFLADAVRRVREKGGRIVNLDVTLVCEAPRIGPHREVMRRRIAEIAAIGIERVAVKATTNEGLGFIGRREGIAALAVATVALPRDA